jgi:flagellar biosynthesis GTPase FlhF
LKPGVPQHVRINVSSESVKGGSSKLILADRLQPVDLLVQLVRNKFGASKKFACLLLLPSREKLDEDRLLSLKDGASLILTSDAADAATNSSLRVANKKQQHAQLQVQAPAQVFEDHDDAFRKEESRPAEAPSSEPQKKSSCEYSNLLHDEDNFSTPSPRAVGDEEANTSLKTWYAQLSSQPEFSNILSKRRALPIFRKRDRILEMSSENQVIIISGETGSGKTTQVIIVM